MKIIPQPWRWLFRVYGISPVGNRKDKYITAISFFTMLVYSVVAVVVNRNSFDVSKVINTILYFLAIFSFLAYNYLFPERHAEIEKDLKRIDKEMKELTKDKIDSSSVSPNFIIWVVLYGLLLPLMIFSFKSQCLLVAFIWVGNLLSYVPMLQQVLLVHLVHNRFTVLNQVLSGTVVGPDTPALLNKVFRVHSSLHAVVDDINTHYSIYSFFRFISMFLFWVTNMHTILLFISGDNDNVVLFYFSQHRTFMLTGFFLLQTLTCHSCSQTANRTVTIVHLLLQPDTDPSIWDQVRMFSALVTDNKVVITNETIFTLDRALVTKTALTALSYLIVAIQLKNVSVFGGDGGFNVTTTTLSPSSTI